MKGTVNERIKALRNKLNLSQQDFGKAIGASFTTVSRWETGQTIPAKNLYRINQVFGTSMEWLEDGIGEMEIIVQEKEHETSNPWKDEAYNNLKEENSFLKSQIQMMREMMRVLNPQANFNLAFGIAGHSVVGQYVGISPQMSVKSVREAA